MDVGSKQYTGLSLDYRLKLWAPTTASRAVSAVAALLVFKVMQMFQQYTVSQKKVSTFKLSVTLSNLNRFKKILHCWKAYDIWYTDV